MYEVPYFPEALGYRGEGYKGYGEDNQVGKNVKLEQVGKGRVWGVISLLFKEKGEGEIIRNYIHTWVVNKGLGRYTT